MVRAVRSPAVLGPGRSSPCSPTSPPRRWPRRTRGPAPAAEAIPEAGARLGVLGAAAAALPAPGRAAALAECLTAAWSFPRPAQRDAALAALTPHLAHRQGLGAEAADAAAAISTPRRWAEAWAALAAARPGARADRRSGKGWDAVRAQGRATTSVPSP